MTSFQRMRSRKCDSRNGDYVSPLEAVEIPKKELDTDERETGCRSGTVTAPKSLLDPVGTLFPRRNNQ